MRIFASILLLAFLSPTVINAQEAETKIEYRIDGNTVIQEKVETQRTPLNKLSTAQIDSTVINSITDDQWADLFAGNPITASKSNNPILTGVSYIAKTASISPKLHNSGGVLVFYNLDNISKKANAERNIPISVFLLYVPFMLVITLSLLARKRQNFLNFVVASISVVAISIIVGEEFGIFAGFGVGIFGGAVAGILTIKISAEGFFYTIDRNKRRTIAGLLVGLVATMSPSMLAGGFAANLASANMNTAILWQYLLIYAGMCLLALGIRELVQLIRSRRVVPETTG